MLIRQETNKLWRLSGYSAALSIFLRTLGSTSKPQFSHMLYATGTFSILLLNATSPSCQCNYMPLLDTFPHLKQVYASYIVCHSMCFSHHFPPKNWLIKSNTCSKEKICGQNSTGAVWSAIHTLCDLFTDRNSIVLLLSIFRRAPHPVTTRRRPCAHLLSRGHPAP
jgi:hypothetical protein